MGTDASAIRIGSWSLAGTDGRPVLVLWLLTTDGRLLAAVVARD